MLKLLKIKKKNHRGAFGALYDTAKNSKDEKFIKKVNEILKIQNKKND